MLALRPYSRSSWPSMKYMTPASLAPTPLLSVGMMVSASDSTNACSETLRERKPVSVSSCVCRSLVWA